MDLRIGGSLAVQHTAVDITDLNTGVLTGVEETNIVPLLHASADARLTDWLGLVLEADGLEIDRAYSYDWAGYFRWQAGPQWDWTVGYRAIDRRVDSDRLTNRLDLRMLVLGVAYSW